MLTAMLRGRTRCHHTAINFASCKTCLFGEASLNFCDVLSLSVNVSSCLMIIHSMTLMEEKVCCLSSGQGRTIVQCLCRNSIFCLLYHHPVGVAVCFRFQTIIVCFLHFESFSHGCVQWLNVITKASLMG